MNVKKMQRAAADVSNVMRVLSHPGRLMVLCHLAEGEKSVGDLARSLGMRDAAMSQQLSLLRRDGLVDTRRDGHTIFYALARQDVKHLLAFLYATYCR